MSTVESRSNPALNRTAPKRRGHRLALRWALRTETWADWEWD